MLYHLVTAIACVALISTSSSTTTVVTSNNFHECQREYDQNIGQLVASSGMRAASTVWRILFDNLDLNSNKRLSASEIVMKLNAEDSTLSEKMTSLLSEAQQLIDLVQPEGGDHELKLNGFVDAIGKSIGRVENVRPANENASDLLLHLCSYFNQKIPEIVGTIKDLTNCTSFLKRDQIQMMGSKSNRIIGNLWKATFLSLNENALKTLAIDELSHAYLRYHPNASITFLDVKSSLSSYMEKGSLNQPQFLQMISSLLFETPSWENATSTRQLVGKQMFCSVLRSSRDDVIAWLQRNKKCADEYKQALIRYFGEDSAIVSGIIFTFADQNKDADLTSSELESFVQTMTHRDFNVIDILGNKLFSIKALPLPDQVIEIRNQNDSASFELSILSIKQHESWNSYCLSTTRFIQLFPRSSDDLQRKGNFSSSQLISMLRDMMQRFSASERVEMINSLNNMLNTFTVAIAVGPTAESAITKIKSTTSSEPIPASTDKLSDTRFTTPLVHPTDIASTSTHTASESTKESEIVRELHEQVKETNSSSSERVITEEEKELHELVNNNNKEIEIKHSNTIISESNKSQAVDETSEEAELERLLLDAVKEPTSND